MYDEQDDEEQYESEINCGTRRYRIYPTDDQKFTVASSDGGEPDGGCWEDYASVEEAEAAVQDYEEWLAQEKIKIVEYDVGDIKWSDGIVATVSGDDGRYCNIVDDELTDQYQQYDPDEYDPAQQYWIYFHPDPDDPNEYSEEGGYPSLEEAIEDAKRMLK